VAAGRARGGRLERGRRSRTGTPGPLIRFRLVLGPRAAVVAVRVAGRVSPIVP
jgi:hypothetical protein